MTAMQQIEQLTIEARRHGMTYGEYVRKHNPKMPEPDPVYQGKGESLVVKPKKYKPREGIEMVCEDCGKTFTAKRKDKNLCPNCKKLRRSAYQKAWRENKKAEAKVDYLPQYSPGELFDMPPMGGFHDV